MYIDAGRVYGLGIGVVCIPIFVCKVLQIVVGVFDLFKNHTREFVLDELIFREIGGRYLDHKCFVFTHITTAVSVRVKGHIIIVCGQAAVKIFSRSRSVITVCFLFIRYNPKSLILTKKIFS